MTQGALARTFVRVACIVLAACRGDDPALGDGSVRSDGGDVAPRDAEPDATAPLGEGGVSPPATGIAGLVCNEWYAAFAARPPASHLVREAAWLHTGSRTELLVYGPRDNFTQLELLRVRLTDPTAPAPFAAPVSYRLAPDLSAPLTIPTLGGALLVQYDGVQDAHTRFDADLMEIGRLEMPPAFYTSWAVHPGGTIFESGHADGNVRLYRVAPAADAYLGATDVGVDGGGERSTVAAGSVGVAVAWKDGSQDCAVALFDSVGAALAPARNLGAVGACGAPRVAVLADGQIVVVRRDAALTRDFAHVLELRAGAIEDSMPIVDLGDLTPPLFESSPPVVSDGQAVVIASGRGLVRFAPGQPLVLSRLGEGLHRVWRIDGEIVVGRVDALAGAPESAFSVARACF